jgi:tetratricopeptide (TPR) repeat protein
MTHPIGAVLLSVCLLIPAAGVAGTTLRGKVMLVGAHHELMPAEGVMVTLEETGDSERTKAGGLFNLPLPDAFGAGERITVQVDKEGWRIQYPLDGELRVSEPTDRGRVAIRLLPLGSKKWWSDDRIEKFIADIAVRAKEQIGGEKEKQTPDFGRYIKEWATQYGFSVEEAWAEIERWVSEVQQKQDDLYKLGLAAFAEKNFARANELFLDSVTVNAERMRETERHIEAQKQRVEEYREATILDYCLAGDAAYNDYAFTKALDAYRAALDFTDQGQRPRQWAEVTMDVAKANYQIGVRTEGPAVQQRLAEAVAAYRAALEVYTRALLPQQWATTQNNLGTALSDQGTRTGGEEGRRLLAEVVAAFRGALEIYQAAGVGRYMQIIERNIALTGLFVSAESDADIAGR